MSRFTEILSQGAIPSPEDWQAHLVEAHKAAPSMTPAAFEGFATPEGLASYEVLAQELTALDNPNAKVLDLACGDGYLSRFYLPKLGPDAHVTAVDMSPRELEVARRRVTDGRVEFQCSTADKLLISSRSIDIVLCHLGFMLMAPIEPIVTELKRVLKPGGKFSAVIGRNADHQGVMAELDKVRGAHIVRHYPQIKSVKAGDPRAFSVDGWKSLFGEDLKVESVDFSVGSEITPEKCWEVMKNLYFIGILPEDSRVQLQKDMIAMAQSKASPAGTVFLEWPLRKLTIQLS